MLFYSVVFSWAHFSLAEMLRILLIFSRSIFINPKREQHSRSVLRIVKYRTERVNNVLLRHIQWLPNKLNFGKVLRRLVILSKLNEIKSRWWFVCVCVRFFVNHNHSTHPSICAQFQINTTAFSFNLINLTHSHLAFCWNIIAYRRI